MARPRTEAPEAPAEPEVEVVWGRGAPPPDVAPGLHAKMAQAQAAIEHLPKDKHVDVKNASGQLLYGYDYIGESALMSAVRRELVERGVAVYVSVEQQRREGSLTFVELVVTFVDVETGQSFAIRGQGQGSDTGDKGAAKAITSGTRYTLWKQFLVSTEQDDPAGDTRIVNARRDDEPATMAAAIGRLEAWVETAQPWIAEACEVAFGIDPEKPVAGQLDQTQKGLLQRRLVAVVLDLEDQGKDSYSLDDDVLRSMVRASFAKYFPPAEGSDYDPVDGTPILGPDPFARPIPFG